MSVTPSQWTIDPDTFDAETAALERALTERDTDALAAMLSVYRADAKYYRGVAEERDATIDTLMGMVETFKSILRKAGVID